MVKDLKRLNGFKIGTSFNAFLIGGFKRKKHLNAILRVLFNATCNSATALKFETSCLATPRQFNATTHFCNFASGKRGVGTYRRRRVGRGEWELGIGRRGLESGDRGQ